MIRDSKQPWILVGYNIFSKEGQTGLKVEVIARKVGKNKSSFYHHFADTEIFIEALLNYHLERAVVIADMEKSCKNVVPDLLNVLIEVKEDLLFNRQLRVNRQIPAFKNCFEKSSKTVGEAILGIWAEMLGLGDNSHLAQIVLNLSLENFYLQITDDSLTYDFLLNYINDLKKMVTGFQMNEKKKSILYGSV
jgi:AcrR family transcriptional regulator